MKTSRQRAQKLLRSLSIILTIMTISHVHAMDEHDCKAGIAALKKAKKDVETRFTHMTLDSRLSYIKEKIDANGRVQVYQYLPQAKAGGIWKAVQNEASDNTSEYKNWDNDALFKLEDFDFEQLMCKSATNDSWIFELPSLATVKVNSKESSKLKNLFQAELIVSKQDSVFTGFKIFSLEPFSPEFGVNISEFEQSHEVSEAWPDGPIVSKRQDERVKGKMGFLISIDEKQTTVYSKFKIVDITNENRNNSL